MPEKQIQTLRELLQVRAEEEPARGIQYAECFTTYGELLQRATHLASHLVKFRNDIVLLAFDNHRDNIEYFWACILSGVQPCPIARLAADSTTRRHFLDHLHKLFRNPVLIGSKDVVEQCAVSPQLRALRKDDVEAEVIQESNGLDHEAVCGDVVLLNLSSGSTGKPKGICLTNQQMLSSVRGKNQMLSSTIDSKFLSYIPFDHVASSMEVHMHALFAGADQVQLPTVDVISNPIIFLHAIQDHRITHAFTPNFLFAGIIDHPMVSKGQLLDLSTLKHIVCGGEAVPIKSACQMADYMHECGAVPQAITTAFGMTETGGGSIYAVNPYSSAAAEPGQMFLPVGKCATGIEMRIVSNEKRLPTNQIGELQVRGTSVFPGYLHNPQVTEASFADGWFRTGDIARIDANGNLWLEGRSKDSIIVNGVKYSASEIEAFLEEAKIPGMTPTYTIVSAIRLPDAATETFAVFYLPQDQADLRQVGQRVNEICQQVCGLRPHVVLPLGDRTLAKTSLGKLSRSAIALRYMDGVFAQEETELLNAFDEREFVPASSATEKALVKAASVLFQIGQEKLSVQDSLFDLGGTSMHLMRYRNMIGEELGLTAARLPVIVLMRHPVIADLASAVEEILAALQSTEATYSPIVPLQLSGTKTPLFLVHPGVGEVLVFVNLARYFTGERPVYALRARGFEDEESPFETFEEMVETYTKAIKCRQSQGPYAIAGYSFGGAVAFEIAKKLEAGGDEVRFLGIFNLPPYMRFRLEQLNLTELAVNLAMFLSLIPPEQIDDVEAKMRTTKNKQEQTHILLQHADPARLQELNASPEYIERWIDLAFAINSLGRTYDPSGSQRGIHVFYADPILSMGTRQEYLEQHLDKWRQFADGPIRYISCDGAHYTMLDQVNVRTFQSHLRNALRLLDF